MFFADPTAAFANLRRGLRPGDGSPSPRGGRRSSTRGSSCRCARPASTPRPCPKPVRTTQTRLLSADAERVRRILVEAGFIDAALAPHDFDLDIALGRGLDAAVEAVLALGPTSRMPRWAKRCGPRRRDPRHPRRPLRPARRRAGAARRIDLDRHGLTNPARKENRTLACRAGNVAKGG